RVVSFEQEEMFVRRPVLPRADQRMNMINRTHRTYGSYGSYGSYKSYSLLGSSMSIVERARGIGIIPVVSVPKLEDAWPLAEALLEGGCGCAEITFRTAPAAEAIARIRLRFPEILLGAGTVLTVEQAETAISAGAEFIVSPGTNPTVVDHCLSKGVTIFPGV